jgi:2-keto-4-pentenoate hydratase/2-oxohepta-3-ene-1,7-dioic acid hydratase in catechol pathway
MKRPTEIQPESGVTLRPVLPRPSSIRDYSSFEQHIRSGLKAMGKELGDDWYQIPPFWFSNPNCVHGHDDLIQVPGNTHEMDFELEVAAIIGKPGRDIDPKHALDHVAGFTIFNDWSARDLQHREMQCMPVGPSKGKDFANSLGPYLVTTDELAPYDNDGFLSLAMTAFVNGKQYSGGNLADMYWRFSELVAYASRGATLLAGDVIGSGTCGTGCILELSATHGVDKYPWLKEGDEIILEVEQLGSLRNRVTWGPEPIPLRS